MSDSHSAEMIQAIQIGLAGHYHVDREIGAGGMAVVYLARDLRRDRLVALKVLRPEVAGPGGAERFNLEIRVTARLVHPNILPVLDSGEVNGRLWYTMPFVEGESLRSRLRRERQLPLDETVRLTTQVADALQRAHEEGILHRDIKPENILLASGHALVADFGIARAVTATDETITRTGIALGTPAYMSPEQSTGEQHLDARSDLYSLAAMTYEMLAGEPPFTGPTAQAVIARRLTQAPPSLRAIRRTIPEAVDATLQKALSVAPADRYQSTREFVHALSESLVAPPPRSTARQARVGVIAAIGVIILAAGIVARIGGTDTAPPDNPDRNAVRLAVLPFGIIGGDSNTRYLAEGITTEVSTSLSNLSGLRVIDGNSVQASVGEGRTAREIGALLRVDALVDGDVQKAGDAIRVRVKLVDPATLESRWSQTYDHTARDVFEVQSEVASKVAGVLRIQLAERETRSLNRPPTTSPEAYDAFLRARARSGPGESRALRRVVVDSMIADLTRAVTIDSTFATAWAYLAASLVGSVFTLEADTGRLDLADRAIRIALRLDSTLAIAWKARHDLAWTAERGWRFAEALGDVRHALTLQPSLVVAHNALASLYFHYGFTKEARDELAASLSLDPRDGCPDVAACIGFSRPRVARVLWYEQKFDSALAIYDAIPFLGGFVWEQAVVLNALGRSAEAIALLDSSRAAGDVESVDRLASRALIHATLGHTAQARAHIDAVVAPPRSRSHFHHAQFTIACAWARLGRKGEAVEWLRRTAENGMPNYPLFRNDPNLQGLRGDPGYERLMEELRRQFEANAKLVRGGTIS